MYYCGIDVGKYHHEGSEIDEGGKALLDSLSFKNVREGCEKLLALFGRLSIMKEELLLSMEAILSEYYLSLRARGKHHLTTIGAVSRKFCNTIYILKENRPWQPIPPYRSS